VKQWLVGNLSGSWPSDSVTGRIGLSCKSKCNILPAPIDRYQALLDKNANQTLSAEDRQELTPLRTDLDQPMLLRVRAAALLQWGGYQIPPADKL
jgi:hypothetical protein